MQLVLDLNLDRYPDSEFNEGGFRAKRRPDIAPMAFEIKISPPVSKREIEKLVEFGGGANADAMGKLYGYCNGLHIGATKFGVFGLLVDPAPNGPTWDINVPNTWERPKSWPDESLIVATSRDYSNPSIVKRYYHSIMPDGCISVNPEDDFSVQFSIYRSIDVWLEQQINSAQEQKSRW